jgi:hypothetical protein
MGSFFYELALELLWSNNPKALISEEVFSIFK